MLLIVWFFGQSGKQLMAKRRCPLRGLEIEEFRALCLVLQVIRVPGQFVREHVQRDNSFAAELVENPTNFGAELRETW